MAANRATGFPERNTWITKYLSDMKALATELAAKVVEFEAYERISMQYGGTAPRNVGNPIDFGVPAPTTKPRGRPPSAKPVTTAAKRANGGVEKGQSSHAQAYSRVVAAGPSGITREALLKAYPGIRSNHLGAAVTRWQKAGTAIERDGRLFALNPAQTTQKTPRRRQQQTTTTEHATA